MVYLERLSCLLYKLQLTLKVCFFCGFGSNSSGASRWMFSIPICPEDILIKRTERHLFSCFPVGTGRFFLCYLYTVFWIDIGQICVMTVRILRSRLCSIYIAHFSPFLTIFISTRVKKFNLASEHRVPLTISQFSKCGCTKSHHLIACECSALWPHCHIERTTATAGIS